MIKVSILYPYRENGHFDVDCYCAAQLLADIPNYTDRANGTIPISEIKISV